MFSFRTIKGHPVSYEDAPTDKSLNNIEIHTLSYIYLLDFLSDHKTELFDCLYFWVLTLKINSIARDDCLSYV